VALHRFRSIWISDLHLGTRHQQNERLLDFLETTESTYLYLVGDILDLLQAQKKWHWPPVNDRIVQTVLAKAALGTTVFYLPGNHDHLLRQFNGRTVCGVHIRDSLVHETVDNRRYLVVHGDRFDPVVRHLPWLAGLGSLVYEGLLAAGSRDRAHAPIPAAKRARPSFSARMKQLAKVVVNRLGRFDQAVTRAVTDHRAEGIICGHIHRAAVCEMNGFLYTNAGDWVESCTALVENSAGQLGLVEWPDRSPLSAPASATVTVSAHADLPRDRCLVTPN
jgi:UDP-2,3-diacylglucosamine pyrophosphatase LpxH